RSTVLYLSENRISHPAIAAGNRRHRYEYERRRQRREQARCARRMDPDDAEKNRVQNDRDRGELQYEQRGLLQYQTRRPPCAGLLLVVAEPCIGEDAEGIARDRNDRSCLPVQAQQEERFDEDEAAQDERRDAHDPCYCSVPEDRGSGRGRPSSGGAAGAVPRRARIMRLTGYQTSPARASRIAVRKPRTALITPSPIPGPTYASALVASDNKQTATAKRFMRVLLAA